MYNCQLFANEDDMGMSKHVKGKMFPFLKKLPLTIQVL